MYIYKKGKDNQVPRTCMRARVCMCVCADRNRRFWRLDGTDCPAALLARGTTVREGKWISSADLRCPDLRRTRYVTRMAAPWDFDGSKRNKRAEVRKYEGGKYLHRRVRMTSVGYYKTPWRYVSKEEWRNKDKTAKGNDLFLLSDSARSPFV